MLSTVLFKYLYLLIYNFSGLCHVLRNNMVIKYYLFDIQNCAAQEQDEEAAAVTAIIYIFLELL